MGFAAINILLVDSSCIAESSAIQYATSNSVCTEAFTAAQLAGASFCYEFQTTISSPTSGEDCEVNVAAELVAVALIDGDLAYAIGPSAYIGEKFVPTDSPTEAPVFTEPPTTFVPTEETGDPTSETVEPTSETVEPTSETEEPTSETAEPTTFVPTPTLLLDIPETALDYGFTTLVTALTAANLVQALSSPYGPFTVFAPTNAAFDVLGQELLGCLLLPANQVVLQDVLLYHVANGEYLAQQLVNNQVIEMTNTDSILITIDEGTVVVNDNADVVAANIIASNGVLHGIDRVLIPPELNVEEFLETCTSGLVSGCYGSISTRAAGYQFGACDCEMTKEECDAEPKDGQFPIWAPGGCANICLCTEGFGCYQFGPNPPETQNNCDCSPEACEGGEEVCNAKVSSHTWTDQCKSCQCPSDEYDPPCKPIKEPE